MTVADVEEAIRHSRRFIEGDWPDFPANEILTRYAIIDPVLVALGWETWNVAECVVEYDLGESQKPDYVFFNANREPVVVVESKRLWRPSLADFDKDLFRYVNLLRKTFKSRARIGVITDGQSWLLYDPEKRGPYSSRLFDSVDITEGSLRQSARTLRNYLRKDNWW